jgi:4-hydroxybenzoyl-CoA thioesterase
MSDQAAPARPAALFVHRRIITWSDTDAAGIAYSGRFPVFALEAIDAWFFDRLGADWFELHRNQGGGTPFVHMSLDFRASLRPRDELSTTVALRKAGRSSLDFAVTGRLPPDTVSFEGRFVCAFVDAATGKSRAIPQAFQAAVAHEVALASG